MTNSLSTRFEHADTPLEMESGNARHVVITVHGIRTFGRWQERLENLTHAVAPTIEFVHYKYNYFSAIAFLIPPLRWLAIRAFRRHLVAITEKHRDATIDVVAHSFGTHLLAWALLGIPARSRPSLHTILLCGSVLKSTFPWNDLIDEGSVHGVINECATRDWVLVLSQTLVLFTGAAGWFGTTGMTSARLRNNWYRFGHSGFFADAFMRDRWVPALISGNALPIHDERRETLSHKIAVFAAQNIEPIKFVAYASLPTLVALWNYHLYTTATEATSRAVARQLANAAQFTKSEKPGQLRVSALLGIESYRRLPTLQVDTLLRDTSRVLPRAAFRAANCEMANAIVSARWNAIACWHDNGLDVLALPGGGIISRVALDEMPVGVAFSPDARSLALGMRGRIEMYSVDGSRAWRAEVRGPVRLSAMAFGDLQDIEFSPSGHLVCADADVLMCLRVSDGKEVIRLANRDQLGEAPLSIKSWAFSPDEQTVALLLWSPAPPGSSPILSSGAFRAVVVDLRHADRWRAFDAKSDSDRLLFQNSGRRLLFVKDGPRRIEAAFDLSTGSELVSLADSAVSDDGRYVVQDSSTPAIAEIIGSHRPVPLTEPSSFSAAAFSADNLYVAIVNRSVHTDASSVRLLSTSTGANVATFPCHGDVVGVVIDARNRLLTVWTNDVVQVFDIEAKSEIYRMPLDGRLITNGSYLIAADPAQHAVAVYDVSKSRSEELVASWDMRYVISGPAISPDGSLVATSVVGSIQVYSLRDGSSRAIPSGAVKILGFDRSSSKLIASVESQIRIFDLASSAITPTSLSSGTIHASVHVGGDALLVQEAAQERQGTPAYETWVWDLWTAQLRWKTSSAPRLEGAAFSNDGRFLCVAANFGVTRYNAVTGEKIWSFTSRTDRLEANKLTEFYSLSCGNSGTSTYASDDDGHVHIFDSEGRHRHAYQIADSRSSTILLKPSNDRLAVIDANRVRVYDTVTFAELARMEIPDSEFVEGAAWHFDAVVIATKAFKTGAEAITVRRLVSSDELIKQLCDRLPDGLSETDWYKFVAEMPFTKTCFR